MTTVTVAADEELQITAPTGNEMPIQALLLSVLARKAHISGLGLSGAIAGRGIQAGGYKRL